MAEPKKINLNQLKDLVCFDRFDEQEKENFYRDIYIQMFGEEKTPPFYWIEPPAYWVNWYSQFKSKTEAYAYCVEKGKPWDYFAKEGD